MVKNHFTKLYDAAFASKIAWDNFSLKQKSRDIASWGYKTMRNMNRSPEQKGLGSNALRHAALSAISYYVGDLPGSEQARIARRLGVPDETFSKYDTAVVYPLCALPQVAGLIASRAAGKTEGETAVLANLIPGAAINAARAYFAFVRKKPTVSICAKALATNAAHYTPQIKKYLQQNGVRGALTNLLKKSRASLEKHVLEPLEKTGEHIIRMNEDPFYVVPVSQKKVA